MSEISRSLGPLAAMVAGVVLGWFWGQSSALPMPPRAEACETADAMLLARDSKLELFLLNAELKERW